MIVAPEPAEIAVQADPQSLYQFAVADRLAGRPAEAVLKLEQVLAVRPDDVDARLNLGLALLALGRLDAAEAAFLDVTRRTPTYVDAWAGLARTHQRRGDLPSARRAVSEAARLAPGDPDIRALQITLEPPPPWRLDVSAARSRLSGGLPDWTEMRLSVSRRLGVDWSAGAGLEVTERFDNTDVYLEARLDRTFDGGGIYLALGGAPDADYRPEISFTAGGQVGLTSHISATIDASVARYPSGTVIGLHPGVQVNLPGDRVQLSARWINVRDENGVDRSGYTTLARWQATDRVAIRAGYADAPESSEGATVDIKAWNVGADLDLTDRLTLRAGLLSEERDAYDRNEVSLGLGWRF